MCKGDAAVERAVAAVTRGGLSAEADDGWIGRRRQAPDVPIAMGVWNPEDTEADDDATISAHAAVRLRDGMAVLLCVILWREEVRTESSNRQVKEVGTSRRRSELEASASSKFTSRAKGHDGR